MGKEDDSFKYPDWYLEALRGAGRLEEEGKPDEAKRMECQANQALAVYMGVGAKDSQGNLILGEDGSTQLEKLRRK